MNLEFFYNNPEILWIVTVLYDLSLAIVLFYFFGKEGLYAAVVLGIILGNLQGGKVSDLEVFGYTFTVSMGAIMYSGIYFATDLLNEKYGRKEATKAVIIGAVANVVVMLTLVLSTLLTNSIGGMQDALLLPQRIAPLQWHIFSHQRLIPSLLWLYHQLIRLPLQLLLFHVRKELVYGV